MSIHTSTIILFFLYISSEFPILYFILISIFFMSKAEKLLMVLRSRQDFEDRLRGIQEKMRQRDEDIKKQYFENYQISVDSIRKKQGFYVKVINKREAAFPDIEKIKLYLEATLELEKNKNTNITLQKKQVIAQWKNTFEALEEVTKEHRTFADEKRKQIAKLSETIKDLSYKLQTVENKYKVLGQQKLDMAKQNQMDARLTGLGVIPFICEKMDILFQQKLPELNFTQVELTKFKELRNDILRKFDYTVSLLIRKELEKDRIDEEADLQMKYHLAKMEEYKIAAEQCRKKQQESDKIAQNAREQLGRQIDFIYRQKKKYDHYPLQIAELKRHQRKLENDKKKLRKTIEELERRAKKSLGKKVQAMVAAKAAKDAQQRLDRQAAAFREMQIKAGYEPIQIEGIPMRSASVVEPKAQQQPQVQAQQEVEKAISQTSSKKKKQEKLKQPQFEEEIAQETKSQKSSKKKKEEKKTFAEQQGQGLAEETQSQKSSRVKVKKEKIKSEASQEGKSEDTAIQNSSAKLKKEKKLAPNDLRVQKQDDSVSDVSSKSSKKRKDKEKQIQ